MSANVRILPIQPGSDGDGRRRPKTDDFKRNDDHYLERIAALWAKDQGLPTPGIIYRLDKLPDGYGGYEKYRGSDSKHVDRYVYGHPQGVFRSMAEFYPHFKVLMDNSTAFGCTCKLCSGKGKQRGPRKSGVSASVASGSPAQQSPYFAQPQPPTTKMQPRSAVAQDPSPTRPPRRKQVDEEGTPDIYRALIDKLKLAGPEGELNQPIVESMSPDWRTGHAMLMELLGEWKSLPAYVPRQGELVLFVRHLGPGETLGWDSSAQTYRIVDLSSKSWIEKPKWEAGVVTQMPTENVTPEDLLGFPVSKQHSVVMSGFRIEPLSQPNSVTKTYTKQHKYVPLHATRPLALWNDCLNGVEENDWHATVRHALAVTSSFCVIGKYHFKGVWPEATIFNQGLYLGPELVMIGDAVRLYPKGGGQQNVTDIMIITAIKMCLVNLDEASDDDYDEGHPYNTCIHVSGRTYTQYPKRSFDGVGDVPISPKSPLLPSGMQELEPWYHVCDPKNPKARIEIPYQRIIGRCYESAALTAWFSPPKGFAPPAPALGFQAVNARPLIKINDSAESATTNAISRGLTGVLEARTYSQKHDIRIDRDAGKTWFWADTRVEQLDLHEVNGRYVGVKDQSRGREQMDDWRKALKALDGKSGGVEAFSAVRKQREAVQARRESVLGASASALVAGGAQIGGGDDIGMGIEGMGIGEGGAEAGSGAELSGGDAQDSMEVDQASPGNGDDNRYSGLGSEVGDEMDVDRDEGVDEDEGEAVDALAAFRAAPAAANAKGKAKEQKQTEVITLSDDDDHDED
ncbi:hypothetical protein LTR08_002392 [Meristemomyces frigidus]|nr:hypothetical protein LTR08_002392 [Meristemomyces frigidus]